MYLTGETRGGSTIIEVIAGESAESLWEYEWPSSKSRSDFDWLPGADLRGSIRLRGGLMTDSAEIDGKWAQLMERVAKLFEAGAR